MHLMHHHYNPHNSSEAQHAKFVKLTTRPVGHLVTGLAVPAMVSMLVTGIYNIVDTFFVGQINTQSVAALGIVFSYMSIVQSIAFFFGQGAGNYISRALGHEDTHNAGMMASVGLISTWLTGALIAAGCFIYMEPVLRFFGSTATIMPYACDYFGFILLGTPFIMSCFTMNNLMRHQGNAMLSMIGIMSGAVLNVILDPILIFGFDMGVKGAGLATAASQIVAFGIMLMLAGQRGGVPVRLTQFKPTLQRYRDIAAGGLPSLARQSMMGISALILNNIAGIYGDSAIASFSVVNRIVMLANAAMIGYGQGFQPVCGFNYGAGKFDRVRAAFIHTCKVLTIYSTVLAVAGWFFARPLVGLFVTSDPEVSRIGAEVLRYQCLAFPLTGYVVLVNMYLQNIRRTMPATIMAMSRQGIFLIPALFLGNLWLGFLGVEIAQAVADTASFLLAIPLGLHALNKMGTRG